MSYRVFQRAVWQRNPDWPEGYEPLAVPADSCRTTATFNTVEEAREFCGTLNKKWKQYWDKIQAGTATDKQRETYYTAPRYEFTEV